jgi:hypothetical protein
MDTAVPLRRLALLAVVLTVLGATAGFTVGLLAGPDGSLAAVVVAGFVALLVAVAVWLGVRGAGRTETRYW